MFVWTYLKKQLEKVPSPPQTAVIGKAEKLGKVRKVAGTKEEVDFLTKRIPIQLLMEFLDLKSAIALSQVSRQWRAKNNPPDRVSSFVVSVFVRQKLSYKELKQLLKKFNREELPFLKIYSYNSTYYCEGPSLRQLTTLMPRLRTLFVYIDKVDNEHSLALFSGLRNLKIICCVNYELSHIGTLNLLETLEIYNGDGLTDISLQGLSTLSVLRSLKLDKGVRITGDGLRNLSALTALQKLNFTNCHHIVDDDLQHLSHLLALRTLSFSYCEHIGRNALLGLTHCTFLQKLKIYQCAGRTGIKAGALKNIGSIAALRNLTLFCCAPHAIAIDIDGDDLLYLKNCMALQKLSLDKCKITDEGMQSLSNLMALQTLSLRFCEKITNKGLQHLSGLKDLKDLNLRGCKGITNRGLLRLRSCVQLKYLNLEQIPEVTDVSCLSHIIGLSIKLK